MKTTELKKEIEKAIGKSNGTVYVGLRGLYKEENIGKLRDSRVWDDGNMTEEVLPGTCGIYVGEYWDECEFSDESLEKAIQTLEKIPYGDNRRVGVIVGETAVGGEDVDEVILGNAKCVMILR